MRISREGFPEEHMTKLLEESVTLRKELPGMTALPRPPEPENQGKDDDVETELDEDLYGLEDEEADKDDTDNLVDDDEDCSDEELAEARERKKRTERELLEVAQKLQREAETGKVDAIGGSSGVENSGYVSDYADSEEEETSPDEGDDEEEVERRKRARRLVVGAGTNWDTFIWKVGQRFPNRDSFRDAVRRYAIHQGRNITIVTSNKKRGQRLEVKCLPTCSFRLYASWDSGCDCFVVKSVDTGHCCIRNMEKNKQLRSTWLAKQFLEVFKARPHWPAKEIVETVKRIYRVVIAKPVAYKIKYNAHRFLHGSMKEHYSKVGRYLQVIRQSSPETKLVLVTDEKKRPPVFSRLYVCFEGLAKGWIEGCRKVLCIDSCFLKTFLGGQLMGVIGRDGNDQMFPVAWAVVEGENNDSWEWFLTEVKHSLMLNDGDGLAVISDEHLSILAAVKKVLPSSEHRHCARHIYAHWHKTFRGEEYKQLFWRAAKAFNEHEYEEVLAEMEEVSPAAVVAFRRHNPRVFCRSLMNKDTKVDVIVNNLAETFNGFIITARTKHLLYMLEDIRTALMQRLAIKKMEMEKSPSPICPRIQKKLDKAKVKAAQCTVIPSTINVFQVSYLMDVVSVDIEKWTCTCNVWDLSGIPCFHAVACIFFCHKNAEDFVSHWYTRETYLKTYAVAIPPCVSERYWPKVDYPLIPPPIKVGPGRPRKNRIKDPYEDPKKPGKLTKHGVQITCSICKSTTHNKRRCPNKNSEGATSNLHSKRQRVGEHSQGHISQTGEINDVLNATAQPTRTGRGGRVISSGQGSRGGRRGAARGGGGRGRGGRGRGGGRRGASIPVGAGVYVAADGTTYHNGRSFTELTGQSTPMAFTQTSTVANDLPTQSSAAS